MIKVLIADDHPIIRVGFKRILSRTSDMTVAGEAGDSQEALQEAVENDYDVVVLDITMPGGGGISIMKDLLKEKPEMPVLILSMHPESEYGIRALREGASGYLMKEAAQDNLVEAIRTLHQGGKYWSDQFIALMANAIQNLDHELPHHLLSNREFQIMLMIVDGRALTDIAKELCLSVKTVSTYRTRILEKMNMANNAQLIRYAIENNLSD